VNGKHDDELNSESETGIKQMQLVVVNDADRKRYASLIGKNVQVTGTLFHAQNGHHRTPVLLTVKSIQLAADKRR